MSKGLTNEKKILKFNDLCSRVETFHNEMVDIDKLASSFRGNIIKFNFDVFECLDETEKILFLNTIYSIDKNIYEKFIVNYIQFLSII